MSWELQIILTVLAVALGYITGWWFGRRACVDLIEHVELDDNHVEEPMPWRTKAGRRMLAAVGAFAVGAVLIGFGAQQALYQHDQRAERDRDRALTECLKSWGDEVVATLQTRTGATAELDPAVDRRDDAVDDVLAVVALIRRNPPEATEDQLDRRLERFTRAKRDLREAKLVVERARAANPYVPPRLTCQDQTEDRG